MKLEELLPKLIRAGFENDMRNFESISLSIARKVKQNNPEISKEIANAIAYKSIGSSVMKSAGLNIAPVDKETRFSLARLEEPEEISEPILDDDTMLKLKRFIRERNMINQLITEGVNPPTSLLFYGPPGVGKTYIAKWLSHELNMNLIVMDLASSISSYLGKTGQNIKNLLDYARSFPSILFLDEFDAIAKKRDDQSDLGELKRIVNVLLKELEIWPVNCIVIAATNNAGLLDKAIWRRFDRAIEVKIPDNIQRKDLLKRNLSMFDIDINSILDLVVKYTKGLSAADICKLCDHAKRSYIIDKCDPKFAVMAELAKFVNNIDTHGKSDICNVLKANMPEITVREISSITGYSSTSVQRYLKVSK